MRSENLSIGLDGCRGGWLAVWHVDRTWNSLLIRDRTTLREILTVGDRTFIDMPIGLPETEASRLCDRQLRQTLGRAFSTSVFNPPIREAVYATSYADACQLNHAKTGKKISIQSWNLVPKIRELDEIFIEFTELQSSCFESHPELLFYHLHQQKKLNFKKKTPAGQQERLALLAASIEDPQSTFSALRASYLKKEVADDDILDAIVLACFAERSLKTELKSLPNPPEVDAFGIEMGIYYS